MPFDETILSDFLAVISVSTMANSDSLSPACCAELSASHADGGGAACSNLANMGLSGQLPRDERVWGGLPAVTTVNLANNSIQGYAAPEMGQLHMIQDVDFEHNELSGPLPGLANLTQLTNLRLGSNQLSGTAAACVKTIST